MRSGVGRAELLRLMAAFGGELPPTVLAMCGFEESKAVVGPGGLQLHPESKRVGKVDPEVVPPPVVKPDPLPVVEVQQGMRRLSCVRAVKAEPLQQPIKEWPRGNPLPVDVLNVPWEAAGPRAPFLMPWSRLGAGLRHRLGRWRAGVRVDCRKLEQRWGLGLPFDGLPRMGRMTWMPDLVVLVDGTSEVGLFARDADALIEQLRQERGGVGLHVHRLSQIPFSPRALDLPSQAPVLVLSAMGQLSRSVGVMDEWVRLGKRWSAEGRTLLVLNPAPRPRWHRPLTALWPTVWWDMRSRLPRHGRLPPGGSRESLMAEGDPILREALLDLLATGARITPALLRRARLLLGPKADAGLEHDVWHAPGTWRGKDCMGIERGPSHESRLRRRASHPLAKTIGDIVVEHHRDCSLGVQMGCELLALLSGGFDEARAEVVQSFFARVRDRLRLMVTQRDSTRDWRLRVSGWIQQLSTRLSTDMRRDPRIRECLSEAWAWAQLLAESYCEPGTVTSYPDGLDADVVERVLREAKAGDNPRRWGLLRSGGSWLAEASAEEPVAAPRVNLGTIEVGEPSLFVRLDAGAGAGLGRQGDMESLESPSTGVVERFKCHLGFDAQVVELVRNRHPTRVELSSEYERLTFSPLRRPAWARSMSEDRHGLRATFAVRGVTFALRWIPPGSFWMGSPENEPGRFPDEGPRHRVTIKQGFWMGETPVTQEQWRAVAEEAGPAGGLKPSPSYFKRRANLPPPEPYSAQGGLPVEQVSWDDCMKFTRFLSSLSGQPNPDGLSFRLPTEAEWEHACRAGTDTALYTGAIDLDGTSAKALDDIAWYVHNSGPDVDVENPRNPKGWMQEEFPIDRAGTHRVGMKRPNAWGLHDMLGNVWEWCADGKRDYRDEAETDPTGVTGEGDASRVVRGGSWYILAWRCRSAYRSYWLRVYRGNDLGLRLLAGHQFGQEQGQQAGMVGGRAAPSPGPRGSGDARGAGPAGGRTGGGSSTGAKRGGNA